MARTAICILLVTISCMVTGQEGTDTSPEGMVLIPGGTFIMGAESRQGIAVPPHPVTLDPFFMDIREVTNRQYEQFCISTGYRFSEFWGMELYKSGPDYPDHPVVGVSHSDASAYAAWAGKRLPTEAEWEYAARGGLEGMQFPFGNRADHSLARFNDPDAEKGPVETGTYPANGYGLHDMAGNAWEWVADWFGADYYGVSPLDDPTGPDRGAFRVIRGGGWHSGDSCIAVHWRNALPQHWVDMAGGFRCAMDAVEGETKIED